LLDQMGVLPDQRDYAALADSFWVDRLIAEGFCVVQPTGVFPRLELPAGEPVTA
jgi:methionyl-tRNA synthetase